MARVAAGRPRLGRAPVGAGPKGAAPTALRTPHCVDSLPSDEQRHDGRLTCPGGEFQRDTTEAVRAYLVDQGLSAASFHGGMEQQDRERTLLRFRNGSIVFLVASDLAARGLDRKR